MVNQLLKYSTYEGDVGRRQQGGEEEEGDKHRWYKPQRNGAFLKERGSDGLKASVDSEEDLKFFPIQRGNFQAWEGEQVGWGG